MSSFFSHLLNILFRLGYFGPLVMGVLDSSFLFLPFGNDLLVVGLVARHHQGLIVYVLAAATGSILGVLLLDLVARKAGEQGIQKVAGPKRFEYLKRKIGEKGGRALALGCLAPPPFPFTMVVATNSALGYPRFRLLWIVWLARAFRFTVIGLLAVRFGPAILRIANSPAFKWSMVGFIVLCTVGSVISITNWVRKSRRAKTPA
ncbi:MAG: hypothetical protein ACJ74Z_04625 [Bryobacteraceae bacterium]